MRKSAYIGSQVLLILSAILLGVCAGHWADRFYASSVHTHLICQPTYPLAPEAQGLSAGSAGPSYPLIYEYDCEGR